MREATAVLRGNAVFSGRPPPLRPTTVKLCSVVPKAGRAPLSVPHPGMVALTYAFPRLCRDHPACLQLPVVFQALFCSPYKKVRDLQGHCESIFY